MNTFYKSLQMPEDFIQAVETIMQYCQFEDCDKDCNNCPYSLATIRCGDTDDEGYVKGHKDIFTYGLINGEKIGEIIAHGITLEDTLKDFLEWYTLPFNDSLFKHTDEVIQEFMDYQKENTNEDSD